MGIPRILRHAPPIPEPALEGEFVFGYGSLLDRVDGAPTRTPSRHGFVADLRGYRRAWDVAMDNAETIPGYKLYLDRETGERPAVAVAFLDLRADRSASVNGVALPVSSAALDALDRRERNYHRVDVSEAVAQPAGATVWTYLGTPEARERLRRGLAGGRAVISREYLEGVVAGFRGLGAEEYRRYAASTDRPPCPVRELRRVEIPARGRGPAALSRPSSPARPSPSRPPRDGP